jgi:hypothetical protein
MENMTMVSAPWTGHCQTFGSHEWLSLEVLKPTISFSLKKLDAFRANLSNGEPNFGLRSKRL